MRSERYVVSRKTCTRKMPGAYMSEGRVVKTMTTTTYDCSVYGNRDVFEDRLVTKHREEQRTGVRQTTTRTASAGLSGVAVLKWDGGTVRFPVSSSLSAVDTRYESPTGSKGYEVGKSARALEGQVLSGVVKRVVDEARARVRSADGKQWEARAAAAAKAGRVSESEDADVRAAVATGLSKAGSARLRARYGIGGGEVLTALEGTALKARTQSWFVSPTLRVQVKSARANYEAGEQVLERGWAWGLVETGLRMFGASDLPFQSDRSSASFYMRMTYAMLAHLYDDESYGWVLYDGAMLDFWLGGRTSEAVEYSGGGDESPMAAGIGWGYQIMWGHRGTLLGVFGGIRTQRTYRKAGDFRTAGSAHPLVGRLELRVSQRYPVFIEAYGMHPLGEGELTGADVVIATGGTSAIVLRAERLKLNAMFGGTHPKDDVRLGRHQSWTFDVTYGMQF